jgi:hypothetical protein
MVFRYEYADRCGAWDWFVEMPRREYLIYVDYPINDLPSVLSGMKPHIHRIAMIKA